MMSSFHLHEDVPLEDDAGHLAGPEDSWQESFALIWYDPHSRVGAHLHTGLQRNRAKADYWSHVVVDGRIVALEHAIAAPMPEGDYPNLSLGPLAISGVEPLRSYRVTASYNDVECDVTYEAFPGTVLGFRMDASGAAIAKGHFESYGWVTGTVRSGSRTVNFKAFGFHDRSWGSRQYGRLLAIRNLAVNFGPDLYIQTFDCSTPTGRSVIGYLRADGELQTITDITGRTEIADDGWAPLGVDMTLWTGTGRGYRVTGVSDCSAHNVGWGDTLRGVGYLRCELGGRVGGGQIIVGEMGSPAPWQVEALRTDFGKADA